MANQAAIQAHVFYGYGKAAQYLGSPFALYRATTSAGPLSNASLFTLNAAFDADPKFTFKQPSGYPKPILFGLFDGTNVLVGDYLVNSAQGTFFVAGYEPNKPMLCVACNRTLTFSRPSAPAPGQYGGREDSTDPIIASGWPASVLQGTKGEANPSGLPSDVRAPWVSILVPAIPGVILNYSDLAVDDLGRKYVLSNVELQALGYRISATYAGG